MKLRFVTSLLIFISSYLPLGIIVGIKDLNECSGIPEHPGMVAALALVFALAVGSVLIAARLIHSGVPVTVSKVTNKSSDMFTYTIPYMISFYNFNLGDWKTIACLSIFMCIMFILSYKTNNVFVNPVLAIAGYGLYDCNFRDGSKEKQGMLISKHVPIIGDVYVIERLSDFIYFVSSVPSKERGECPQK